MKRSKKDYGSAKPAEAVVERSPFEKLLHLAQDMTGSYVKGQLDAFAEKFQANPANALEWSQRAFEMAARYEVGMTLQTWLDVKPEMAEGDRFARIYAEVRDCVVRGARWPERSSSPVSNYLHQCKIAAWAEVLAKLDGGWGC